MFHYNRELLLENCGIDSYGCFTLVVGARESKITRLILDGNPIGEVGARMLMSLSYTCPSRDVFISMCRCDVSTKAIGILSAADPYGFYDLNLAVGM
jgi:hypothetical protein